MATEKNFVIRKGRTGTIQVTVTGISNWTGLSAKLFASGGFEDSAVTMVLTGTIDAQTNSISFPYVAADTADILSGTLFYEVVIYKDDKAIVNDSNFGMIEIMPVVKVDPTV